MHSSSPAGSSRCWASSPATPPSGPRCRSFSIRMDVSKRPARPSTPYGSALAIGDGDDPKLFEHRFTRTVDYGSAACLIVRADLFAKVGGFDPAYTPAYYEDADLCFKLAERGFSTVFEPRARVVHLRGGTSARANALMRVNRHVFASRWRERLERRHPLRCSPDPRAPSGGTRRREPRAHPRRSMIGCRTTTAARATREWRGCSPSWSTSGQARASRSWRPILAMPSAMPHRSSRTGSKSPVPTSASIAGSNGAGLTTRSSWSAARRISNASTTFSVRRSRRRDGSTTSRPSRSGGSSRKAPSRRSSCASSTRRASRGPTSSSASPRRRQPSHGARSNAPVFVLPDVRVGAEADSALRRAERRRVLRRVPRRAQAVRTRMPRSGSSKT